MRQLNLTTRTEIDWSKRFLDEKDYDELVNEDCFVRKPDGSPLMILLKGIIPKEVNAEAWSVLKKFNPKTEARGNATGIKTLGRKKQDGTISKTMRAPKGWEVISGVIGYFERTARFPHCHPCSWNEKFPEKFARVLPLIHTVDAAYKEHLPERYEFQKGFVDRTVKDYVIPGSIFTTVTVNKNFRTACHKDAGDLENGFSCMTVIREGNYSGANLVFPDFRVAANVEMGDLILFDPHQFHGNTQFVKLTKNAQRCSMVYYFRELMTQCLLPSEELERAKNRKPGQPLFDK